MEAGGAKLKSDYCTLHLQESKPNHRSDRYNHGMSPVSRNTLETHAVLVVLTIVLTLYLVGPNQLMPQKI